MRLFISFVVGLVFGIGLYVSGMTQPSKVQGFLDIFGHWDPSLAFVMAGAVVDSENRVVRTMFTWGAPRPRL